MKECYSALHVSARYSKIAHTPGETVTADIFLHDEHSIGRTEEGRLTVTAEFFDIHGAVLQRKEWSATGHEQADKPVLSLGTIEWQAAPVEGGFVLLRLSLSDSQAAGTAAAKTTGIKINDHFFTIGGNAAGEELGASSGTADGHPFHPFRNLPKASIKITPKSGVVELQNISSVAAVGLFLYDADASRFTRFEPGYFSLLPNETSKVSVMGTDIESLSQALRIEGFNIDRTYG